MPLLDAVALSGASERARKFRMSHRGKLLYTLSQLFDTERVESAVRRKDQEDLSVRVDKWNQRSDQPNRYFGFRVSPTRTFPSADLAVPKNRRVRSISCTIQDLFWL